MITTALALKILIALAAAGIGIGTVYFFQMKEDNVVEELCEEVIAQKLGVKVDLSLSSPE